MPHDCLLVLWTRTGKVVNSNQSGRPTGGDRTPKHRERLSRYVVRPKVQAEEVIADAVNLNRFSRADAKSCTVIEREGNRLS